MDTGVSFKDFIWVQSKSFEMHQAQPYRASWFYVLWMRGVIICDDFFLVKGKVTHYEGEKCNQPLLGGIVTLYVALNRYLLGTITWRLRILNDPNLKGSWSFKHCFSPISIKFISSYMFLHDPEHDPISIMKKKSKIKIKKKKLKKNLSLSDISVQKTKEIDNCECFHYVTFQSPSCVSCLAFQSGNILEAVLKVLSYLHLNCHIRQLWWSQSVPSPFVIV